MEMWRRYHTRGWDGAVWERSGVGCISMEFNKKGNALQCTWGGRGEVAWEAVEDEGVAMRGRVRRLDDSEQCCGG